MTALELIKNLLQVNKNRLLHTRPSIYEERQDILLFDNTQKRQSLLRWTKFEWMKNMSAFYVSNVSKQWSKFSPFCPSAVQEVSLVLLA